ncbi:MAG: deoxyribonuclease IV [Lachnospiraceae bacterium]|nr:deoxyribonuclease IV [Lachnospiraceae bacterium]
MMKDILLGSHCRLNSPDMFLGSVKEAASYGANTFMVYTGAPQNTKRKDISELKTDEGRKLMKELGMTEFVVHAPYIINLGNTVKPETYRLAEDFLAVEIERTMAMGSHVLVLHPGAAVGAERKTAIDQIIGGLNNILKPDMDCSIALETMAGKGSEVGSTFEEIAEIISGCAYPEKLSVCFDTCHVNDAGYDIVNDFDGVMDEFDRIIGKDRISVFHINDSKNPLGAHKDRHANIGDGFIGFETLAKIVWHPDFRHVPKILETPYIPDEKDPETKNPPYKEEIARLRAFGK